MPIFRKEFLGRLKARGRPAKSQELARQAANETAPRPDSRVAFEQLAQLAKSRCDRRIGEWHRGFRESFGRLV